MEHSASFARTPRGASADRSGLRHDGRSGDKTPHRHSLSRPRLLFLLAPAAAANSPPIRKNICTRRASAAQRRAPEGAIYTCPMHPEVRQHRPGLLPDLRHGARTRSRRRETDRPRTCRHDAPVLDLRGAGAAGRGAGHGRRIFGPAASRPHRVSTYVQFVLATPVVLWGGWPFFVRGCAIARHAQPQHVHADRDGHRRRLSSTASSRRWRPDCFPRRFATRMAASRSISKPPP